MNAISDVLTEKLEYGLRRQVLGRIEAMLREIQYLAENDHDQFQRIRLRGWTQERLEVLCILNSFYQVVLGPLASSARERTGQLGTEIPLLYGNMRFDRERALALRAAHRAFMSSLAGIPRSVLTAPHASDLIFALSREAEENGDE